MSYKAKVIEVMVATPGDVAEERQLIRDVVYEWNYLHSEDKDLVLLPLGWESHASPSMGDRAQAIINKQVLENCDLLIAAFWTKLGTPTGKYAGGTVEEIEEHLKAGKPAMLYFCTKPVTLDSAAEKKRKALLAFKEDCRQRGLIAEYGELTDFKEKLAKHLAHTVLRHFVKKNGPPSEKDLIYRKPPKMPALSSYAKTLLREAAKDGNGSLLCFRSNGRLSIYTNGSDLVASAFPRHDAKWEAALRQLQSLDLLAIRGRRAQEFQMTSTGYEIASLLRREPLVHA